MIIIYLFIFFKKTKQNKNQANVSIDDEVDGSIDRVPLAPKQQAGSKNAKKVALDLASMSPSDAICAVSRTEHVVKLIYTVGHVALKQLAYIEGDLFFFVSIFLFFLCLLIYANYLFVKKFIRK